MNFSLLLARMASFDVQVPFYLVVPIVVTIAVLALLLVISVGRNQNKAAVVYALLIAVAIAAFAAAVAFNGARTPTGKIERKPSSGSVAASPKVGPPSPVPRQGYGRRGPR